MHSDFFCVASLTISYIKNTPKKRLTPSQLPKPCRFSSLHSQPKKNTSEDPQTSLAHGLKTHFHQTSCNASAELGPEATPESSTSPIPPESQAFYGASGQSDHSRFLTSSNRPLAIGSARPDVTQTNKKSSRKSYPSRHLRQWQKNHGARPSSQFVANRQGLSLIHI